MTTLAALSDHQRLLLTAAGAAPSVLNAQPWLFRFAGQAVELYEHTTRRLPALDPHGRQLAISCGAALLNLRIAARRLGYEPVARLLPDPSRPTLLASVDLSRRRPPGAVDERLFAAIGRRHTARAAYSDERLPVELAARLEDVAESEGAVLRVLPRAELATMLELVARADDALRQRQAVRDELTLWVGDGAVRRHDGLPTSALGMVDLANPPAIRDFELRAPACGRPLGRSEAQPNLLLLSTYGDRAADWLRAGQALQRLLLEVSAAGLVASFLSQPVEDERVRAWVRDPERPLTRPQMVLRVGRGEPGPATPRRPVTDLVLG